MVFQLGVTSPTSGPIPASGGEVVTLTNGRRALLRPMTTADRSVYLAGFEHLSRESRLKRFLGPKPWLTETEIQYFIDVDHIDHEAIVAVVGDEGVGVARFIRDPQQRDVADVAVAVVDEWQRRGVGSALLRRLGQRAREEGIARLRATMMWSNRGMLATIKRLGAPHRTVSSASGVLEMEITLGSVAVDNVA
jgi:GNAT superfamily N-acetyltransferase